MNFQKLTEITFIRYPTGEVSLRLDGSQPDGDDCLTLPITARDDGGVYFCTADAERLAEFMAGPLPSLTPRLK